MNNIKVIPLIPSFEPDEKLIKYVNSLIKEGFKKIIIVNDGSSNKYDYIFNKLSKMNECIVLKHDVNLGKGMALKTGLKYYLDIFSDYNGIVSADSDGQHSAKDTLNLALELEKDNSKLILGVRDFDNEHVPFRSKFGNKLTTNIFKMLYGVKINDTQTGLRAFGNDLIKEFLNCEGKRFEYEINMLITCVKKKIDIKEIKIETIYINKNESTHFNAIKDSFKIYKVLFKEKFK